MAFSSVAGEALAPNFASGGSEEVQTMQSTALRRSLLPDLLKLWNPSNGLNFYPIPAL
jgi:hypothetical protein